MVHSHLKLWRHFPGLPPVLFKQSRNIIADWDRKSKMASADKLYEDAVFLLHSDLVSDPSVVKVRNDPQKVSMMRTFLKRLGLTDKPAGMDIIHVSGTKGKGSTCAFCESILRQHHYKTGMFSSPHMNEVRERVRIDGRPISKEMFARYFWEVYTKLKQTATTEELNVTGGLPAYFNFTVLMSMYVFVKEKVDVSIFEVGIGGEYDATNFLLRPSACGVTSLGYDHLTVLGDTLDQIAWHKAGIFKKGCPAITTTQEFYPRRIDHQRKDKPQAQAVSLFRHVWDLLWRVMWPFTSISAWLRSIWRGWSVRHPMQVILDRAVERQCPLYVAPSLSEDILSRVELGISGNKQPRNAALAVQICKMVRNKGGDSGLPVAKRGSKVVDIPQLVTSVDDLDEATLEGLRNCYWPGRTEVLRHGSITYYLDGAHTEESIEHCAEWFKEEANKEKAELERENRKVVRLLVFNLTKNRNPGNLLKYLTSCGFDEAVFTPHMRSTVRSGTMMDHFDKHLTDEARRLVPQENRATWDRMTSRSQPSLTFPSILQALAWVTQGRDPLVKVPDPSVVLPEVPSHYREASYIQVLVTGSLLLVGPVLGILKPGMND